MTCLQVEYKLTTGELYFKNPRTFRVSPHGLVTTAREFDRERQDAYQIEVTAKDFGNPPNSQILRIRINILDDNDHDPKLPTPLQGNISSDVDVSTRRNTTVTTVLATDQDLGQNASLTYSITAGADDVFDIDPHTGRVFTQRRLYNKDIGE